MLPRRRPATRPTLALTALTGVLLMLVSALTVTVGALPGNAAPAKGAANPVTPGTFTGQGFDQCNAPSQHAMDVWREHSPFRAVGIYISGNSRFCREQPNLTPAWVSTQLSKGWRLLPITLGPQASCQPRFPRYGKNIDPTISTSKPDKWAVARAQARQEADRAVAAARALGIVPGSTLFYDLEGWDLNHSKKCTNSAKWFLSSWSNRLHAHGYLSGVYSSAGSGIVMLEKVRLDKPAKYVLPDVLWIARWDGVANTSAPAYLSEAGWANGQRVKQYRGGHNETWPAKGGVTINIDSNYLDLRTRAVPAPVAEPGGTATPPTTATPAAASMADPRCTSTSISKRKYRRTSATQRRGAIDSLQCLLKQQGLYVGAVTGTWDARTTTALRAFQARVGHRQRAWASRADWVALVTLGSSKAKLRKGSWGADVTRVQRAMNAATGKRLKVTGQFTKSTRKAVKVYKKRVLGKKNASGVVGGGTWKALHRGKR